MSLASRCYLPSRMQIVASNNNYLIYISSIAILRRNDNFNVAGITINNAISLIEHRTIFAESEIHWESIILLKLALYIFTFYMRTIIRGINACYSLFYRRFCAVSLSDNLSLRQSPMSGWVRYRPFRRWGSTTYKTDRGLISIPSRGRIMPKRSPPWTA